MRFVQKKIHVCDYNFVPHEYKRVVVVQKSCPGEIEKVKEKSQHLVRTKEIHKINR